MNRGFAKQSETMHKNPWFNVLSGNPFKIKDYSKKFTDNDRIFKDAEEEFKSRTRDSLNRDHLKATEVRKMVPVSSVLAGLGLATFTYKVVDHFVT